MAERALRLFFALPLPPELREGLARWQAGQGPGRGTQAPVRWARPEGLHLTLAFLGERSGEALPALEAAAAAVADRHRTFGLATTGLGGFPGTQRARVLWLGLEASPALEALAADLRGALAAAGEAFDPKPFRAHLTLARFRRPRPLAGLGEPPPAAFAVANFALFESGPQGSDTALRSWPLRGV